MQPAARLAAAIELADEILAAALTNGAAADTLIRRYFAARRYAGSGDRAAIRALLFDAIRFSGERPPSGRALLLGFATDRRPDLLPLFDGSPHGPAPVEAGEPRSSASPYPAWLKDELGRRFGARLDEEAAALLQRAPLDLRVNPRRGSVGELAEALAATPIPGLPQGLRLAEPRALDRQPQFLAGAFEVQDAGSQRVLQLAAAQPGETVVDLCAGAGGKTLGLAAGMEGRGRLVACDTSRRRLTAMGPRLQRAGDERFVERRLLNPGAETAALADLAGSADLVLVDSPCSGSGTWRRNPELRWRLDRAQLAQLLRLQRHLIAIGATLLRPGGRLIYAVCSLLPAEGEAQARAADGTAGLSLHTLRQYSPAADDCDGFCMAQFLASGPLAL